MLLVVVCAQTAKKKRTHSASKMTIRNWCGFSSMITSEQRKIPFEKRNTCIFLVFGIRFAQTSPYMKSFFFSLSVFIYSQHSHWSCTCVLQRMKSYTHRMENLHTPHAYSHMNGATVQHALDRCFSAKKKETCTSANGIRTVFLHAFENVCSRIANSSQLLNHTHKKRRKKIIK